MSTWNPSRAGSAVRRPSRRPNPPRSARASLTMVTRPTRCQRRWLCRWQTNPNPSPENCGDREGARAMGAMNGAPFHLLLNHIPVVGIPCSLLLLLVAIGRKSEELKQVSLCCFVLFALIAIPAYLTG